MPRTSEAMLARLEAILDEQAGRPPAPAAQFDPDHLFTGTREQFEAWIENFKAELIGEDDDMRDRLLIGQAVQAIRRLRRAAVEEETMKLGDTNWCRYQAQSQRDLDRSLKELDARRAAQAERAAAAEARRSPEDFSNMSPWGAPARYRPGGGAWRERIVLDTEVSLWPVIKGTTVEAEEINALLEDAWPVEYLLHCFPKICVADILACIDCDRAGKCGPFRFENKPEYFYLD